VENSITDAQNNTTSYQYDARGDRTAVIDPINGTSHPTTFTYDLMNQLTGITYPDGSSVSFGCDSRGRRTSVTDQNGKITTYAYDDADRLISVTDPANNLTTYNYDTEDNLGWWPTSLLIKQEGAPFLAFFARSGHDES
jgi:YD repeat-containing protein